MKGMFLSTQLHIMNLVPFWMCHCSVIDNFEKVLAYLILEQVF